jgi:alkanesulfonate monooxygenase SsuD/methylene tetrahydromethanopterin reductase-like flavin-dependent oxidoreductase (luciferase family)
MLVRVAAAVDDLSGGRLHFGVGAGWQDREHTNYSYHLGSMAERMARFREAVPIFAHLLRSDEPLTVDGAYYQLHEAVLLPRPARAGGPPIVIGGSGRQVTMPLAARYADEWNGAFRKPEEFSELSAHLDTLLDREGRPRDAVRRTMMGRLDYADLGRAREQFAEFEAVGVQRLMCGWPELDDLSGITNLAKALAW